MSGGEGDGPVEGRGWPGWAGLALLAGLALVRWGLEAPPAWLDALYYGFGCVYLIGALRRYGGRVREAWRELVALLAEEREDETSEGAGEPPAP